MINPFYEFIKRDIVAPTRIYTLSYENKYFFYFIVDEFNDFSHTCLVAYGCGGGHI